MTNKMDFLPYISKFNLYSVMNQHELNVFVFILSTILSFLCVNSSHLENIVLKILKKQTRTELHLIKERTVLQVEQQNYNIVEDFAKYSKIQRKINMIEQKIQDIRDTKIGNNVLSQIVIRYATKFACTILLICFMYVYRHAPVLYIDNASFAPFTKIISYPHSGNYVSLHFWVMCCGATAQIFKKYIW